MASPLAKVVMPGLVPGIHVLHVSSKDVDGRDEASRLLPTQRNRRRGCGRRRWDDSLSSPCQIEPFCGGAAEDVVCGQQCKGAVRLPPPLPGGGGSMRTSGRGIRIW